MSGHTTLSTILLVLASITLLLPTHQATEQCRWEERSGITLGTLVAPAVVLREYSDVKSSRECYQRCCELKYEGCNVATFMSYSEEVICMSVRCEPFDNCIWEPYTAAIAAIIARPPNNATDTFSHVTMSGTDNNNNSNNKNENKSDKSNATSSASAPSDNISTESNVPKTATTARTPKASSVNGELSEAPANVIIPTTIQPTHFVKPQSKDPSNPFHPDYNPANLSNKPTGVVGGKGSKHINHPEDDGNLGTRDVTKYMNGSTHQVNYTMSITIGVLTCIAFLAVMYMAARRCHLFQDRSKYNRLLENPERYAENYSDSEFRD